MQLTLAPSPNTRKQFGDTPLGVIFFSSNIILMRSDIIEEIEGILNEYHSANTAFKRPICHITFQRSIPA